MWNDINTKNWIDRSLPDSWRREPPPPPPRAPLTFSERVLKEVREGRGIPCQIARVTRHDERTVRRELGGLRRAGLIKYVVGLTGYRGAIYAMADAEPEKNRPLPL